MWYCRVCGLDYDASPWGNDDQTPDYSTCACCGVTFGYDDATAAGARLCRTEWLAGGAVWFYPNMKPAHWALAEQLLQIPGRYQ